MITQPTQLPKWLLTPMDQYTGNIPPFAIQKLEEFKIMAEENNTKIIGYIIAEDMREVSIRRAKEAAEKLEREQKAEAERQQKIIEENRRLALLEQERKRQEELERQRLAAIQRIEREARLREYEHRLAAEERLREETRQKELYRQQEEKRKAAIRQRQAQREADQAMKDLGKALALVAGIALVALTGGAALLLLGAMGACRFDPLLIAVCEDGRYICIAEWYD